MQVNYPFGIKIICNFFCTELPFLRVFVSFLDLPQVQPISYQTIREGNPVHLFCLAQGNPEPTTGDYTWTDNQGNNHQRQNLTIGSVAKIHMGEFRCTVNVNSKGGYGTLTGSTTTRITVQCKHI